MDFWVLLLPTILEWILEVYSLCHSLILLHLKDIWLKRNFSEFFYYFRHGPLFFLKIHLHNKNIHYQFQTLVTNTCASCGYFYEKNSGGLASKKLLRTFFRSSMKSYCFLVIWRSCAAKRNYSDEARSGCIAVGVASSFQIQQLQEIQFDGMRTCNIVNRDSLMSSFDEFRPVTVVCDRIVDSVSVSNSMLQQYFK